MEAFIQGHAVDISLSVKSHNRLGGVGKEQIELYLAASNSVLVRMFDFSLLNRETFLSWPHGHEQRIVKSKSFFFRRKVIDGYAGYTRGVQIIRPSRSKAKIFSSLKGSWSRNKGHMHVKFLAYDWRNKRFTQISTDPAATTNYFQAGENSLPFELSPAFFRPEVLLKYKGDRDKYTVGERGIYCRGAWTLRRNDVNEAGQVHAYICDLRNLPYEEQLYWKSFNEGPKAGISQRADEHDFKGKFVSITSPLQVVLSIVKRWAASDMTWWKLRKEALLERVSTPRTSSRDEWAEAFMDLSKLVVECFQVGAIRTRLRKTSIAYYKEDGSLTLLEKFLIGCQ